MSREFEKRSKKVHKMTRSGLVEQDLSTGEEQRISQRGQDFQLRRDSPPQSAGEALRPVSSGRTGRGQPRQGSFEQPPGNTAYPDAPTSVGAPFDTPTPEASRFDGDSRAPDASHTSAPESYYDEMKRQRDREVSFSELSAQEMDMLFLMDKYPSEQFNFSVLGHEVAIESEIIAQAIAALPDEKRDIILLAYFLDMTDGEIGAMLNLVRRTVQYKRTSSLQELKRIMEGNVNE